MATGTPTDLNGDTPIEAFVQELEIAGADVHDPARAFIYGYLYGREVSRDPRILLDRQVVRRFVQTIYTQAHRKETTP